MAQDKLLIRLQDAAFDVGKELLRMRRVALVFLLISITLFTACSFPIEFVVVNQSGQAIEVKYKARLLPNQPIRLQNPATVAVSELSTHGGNHWQELSANQYQLGQDGRDITVQVNQGDAIRIAFLRDYYEEDSWEATGFPIEELAISGADGDLVWTGQQTRRAFSKESKALYTVTYK